MKTIGHPGRSSAITFGLALALALAACKRTPSVGSEDDLDAEESPRSDSVAAPVEGKKSYLEQLTSAPWLGHADDGALVKIEFFAGDDAAAMVCRTNVKTANGNARTERSPFEASSKLTDITWDTGKSSATYSPRNENTRGHCRLQRRRAHRYPAAVDC